jgi:hypothetical protein
MKKEITVLVGLSLLAIALPLQACQPVSGSNFDVQSLDVSSGKVLVNEKFRVSAYIANAGRSEAGYIVPVMVNGIADDRESITVPAGKSQQVVFTLSKSEPGKYEIGIGDKKSLVTVEKLAPAEMKLSALNVNMEQANPGEEVIVTASLSNIGGTEGTYIAELKINGTAEQSEKVVLPAGANYNCVFKLSKKDPGQYAVALGDLVGKFEVLKPVELIQVAVPEDSAWKLQSHRPQGCCGGGSSSSSCE